MNNPERQKDIFDAITGIDDDLIQEAAAPRTRPFPRRLVRIAAIAAVLAILMTALLWPDPNYITGPGILTVHAHGVDEEGKATIEATTLELGVVFEKTHSYNPAHSYIPDFPISFSIDKEAYYSMDLTLEVRTNTGIFENNDADPIKGLHLTDAQAQLYYFYGQEFYVDIDKILYWKAQGFDYNHLKECVAAGNEDPSQIYRSYGHQQNPSFIDIIVKANDLIVGYCVIEVTELERVTGSLARNYAFELVASVGFPMVDGQWQNVKHKYVEEQIQKIHTERGAPA